MAEYKIEFKRDECIGCGACAAVCPDNWEMKDDGKSTPKKIAIDKAELKCNEEAADVCPVDIIKISR